MRKKILIINNNSINDDSIWCNRRGCTFTTTSRSRSSTSGTSHLQKGFVLLNKFFTSVLLAVIAAIIHKVVHGSIPSSYVVDGFVYRQYYPVVYHYRHNNNKVNIAWLSTSLRRPAFQQSTTIIIKPFASINIIHDPIGSGSIVSPNESKIVPPTCSTTTTNNCIQPTRRMCLTTSGCVLLSLLTVVDTAAAVDTSGGVATATATATAITGSTSNSIDSAKITLAVRNIKSSLKKLKSNEFELYLSTNNYIAIKETLRTAPISEIRKSCGTLIKLTTTTTTTSTTTPTMSSSSSSSIVEETTTTSPLEIPYQKFKTSLEQMDSLATLGMRGRQFTTTTTSATTSTSTTGNNNHTNEFILSYQTTIASLQDFLQMSEQYVSSVPTITTATATTTSTSTISSRAP